MLGQLVFDGGRGGPQRALLYGLPVLRCQADPEGFWGERRLKRAGRSLCAGGAVRALVPADFDRWPLLLKLGLRPVDPGAFLRAQAAPLAASLLERQGLAPDRATVALRGRRADGEMLRAALALCPRVRRLTISAPQGGEELAAWLRREYGLPILPADAPAQAALLLQPGTEPEDANPCPALTLFGPEPDLAGLRLSAPDLAPTDREDLPLLSALWEGGRLGPEQLKIT
ncbi:hypothetical protein ACTQ3Z_05705 [Lawsonibacter sp. LCP25S3_F5]